MNPNCTNEMVSTLPTDKVEKQPHPVNQITPVSKYLAMVLFVLLSFMGGYIGYQFAPGQSVTATLPTATTSALPKTSTSSLEKTSPAVLMSPMMETPQIKFFRRDETEGSTKISFIRNRDFEKTNKEILFEGTIEFYPSEFSGTWVGMFTPTKETSSMLPIGEPDGLPEYFYIAEPDSVELLCDSFHCTDDTKDKKFTADVVFIPETLTYETYNSGFDSYPKTLTIEYIDILQIQPTE